jgi:hypothetical protein
MLESIPPTSSMLGEYAPYLKITWCYIKDIANSNFTAALAGAMAGALAAQKIARSGRLRDEFTKELHNSNSAIALTVSCASLGMALKKQHIINLKKSYDEDIDNFDAFKKKINNKDLPANSIFTIKPNLITLHTLSTPISTILEIVLNRLSISGRGIAAASALSNAIQNLNQALSSRNEMISNFKAKQFPEGASFQNLYLGIEYGDNTLNTEYPDIIKAIYDYTNDFIFFSVILCEDLQEHAKTITNRQKRGLNGTPPNTSMVDFSTPRKDGFIPSNAEYEKWLVGFPTKKPEVKKSWRRVLSSICILKKSPTTSKQN